jgi:enoyl-CoA hydratase/carnithine racemase
MTRSTTRAAIRSVVERHYNPVIRQIRPRCQQPVIAAVNGIAAWRRLFVGAGVRHRVSRPKSREVSATAFVKSV